MRDSRAGTGHRRRGVALLLAFALAGRAAGADAPVVVRTTGQEANLLKFDPGNREAPGFSVELMHAIESIDPGLKFVGVEVMRTVRRIDADLVSGRLDMFFGLVDDPIRRNSLIVVDAPVLYVQYGQLAVNADDPVVIAGLGDVRALGRDGVIGVPQGSMLIPELARQGGLYIDDGTPSVDATLKKLQAHRIRFVYLGGAVLHKYLVDHGLEHEIRILPPRFERTQVCLMASRTADPALVARVRRALVRLQAGGQLARLRGKYGLPE